MKKRLLSMLVVLALLFTCVPLGKMTVYAMSASRNDGIWLFPINSSKYNSFSDWAACPGGDKCCFCGVYHSGWGDPYHSGQGGHNGIDISAAINTEVYAAAPGTIVYAAYNGARGNTIIIEHSIGNGYSYYSYYQHLNSFVKTSGYVSAGTVIGKVGKSGGNYLCHLHFGIVRGSSAKGSAALSLESKGWLIGSGNEGRILNNPSQSNWNGNYAGAPKGGSTVLPPLKAHMGSVTYTFNASQVSIGSSNDIHTHSYNEYVYYWEAHPHYKCYKCSCGEVKENRNEPTFVSTCKTCNPAITYKNISKGDYFIRNKDGGYLNVAYGKDANETDIHTHEFGNYNSQVYNIYPSNNAYAMRPLSSKTRVVNTYATTVVSGIRVCLYDETKHDSQLWKFQPIGDGYIIRNAQNSNVCLTGSSSGLIVSEYTGANNQIWYLEEASTVKYDANGGKGAPASQRVRAGYKTVLSAQKPTRQCYSFLGWSTAKNAVTGSWNEKSAVTIYGNTTVYAVWKNQHTYKTTTTKATTSKNGGVTKKCSICGATTKATTYAAKTIKLSATSYTYTGKAIKPKVTVKDSKGKTISSKYYTVKYGSGLKNVGKYKATVSFKGNYSGSKTLYFTINPPKTSVSKLTAAKKSLKVSIKKQSSQTTGYEVQYSTSKKFTSAKKVTIKNYKTTSTTIKSLKAKKTYYVRVRTYKIVSGKKYYSSWSTYKYRKTK